MREDLHLLVGAYALDALTDDEQAAFERHLATCEPCKAELSTFIKATTRLGMAVAEPPPHHLRDQILDRIAYVPQLPAGSYQAHRQPDSAPRRGAEPGRHRPWNEGAYPQPVDNQPPRWPADPWNDIEPSHPTGAPRAAAGHPEEALPRRDQATPGAVNGHARANEPSALSAFQSPRHEAWPGAGEASRGEGESRAVRGRGEPWEDGDRGIGRDGEGQRRIDRGEGAAGTRRGKRRPKSYWVAVGVAAASLAAIVGSGVVTARTQQRLDRVEADSREVAAIFTAPDARAATGRVSSGGTVTIVASRSRGKVIFSASSLRRLAGEQTYQLWLMSGGGVRPAGLLRPDGGGGISPFIVEPLQKADRVGVTVEPAGGSPQPTTAPVLVLKMSKS